MLTELCAEIRNYFVKDKHFGKFTISGGTIAPLDFLQEGQYFRIIGSVFNDGIYQYGETGVKFTDETFTGAIWALAIPPAVIQLSEEIEKYKSKDETSAYISESFSGYSYTKATGKNGLPVSWQEVFANRLNKWRKI